MLWALKWPLLTLVFSMDHKPTSSYAITWHVWMVGRLGAGHSQSISLGPAVLRLRRREASVPENLVLFEQPAGIFVTLQRYADLLPASGKPRPDCSKPSPNPDQEQWHD